MPAIKKKWIKANRRQPGNGEFDEERNGDVLEEEDREQNEEEVTPKVASPKPKKRSSDQAQDGMLRGLEGEVLLEKRKRFVPPAESKLNDWLENNLEKRDDVKVSLVQLYKYYTEICQSTSSDIVDVPVFNRMIKTKFGKTFGLKESSLYKSVLKEQKLNEQKKVGGGVKLKEIAHEAINHYGNPFSGVRFFSLKQFIGTKYPALKIDQRPKILKRILEMGVGYGQIELVKGIGMAGFYRLPGAKPPPPKKKEKDEQKESKDSEKSEEEKTEKEDGGDADIPTEEDSIKKVKEDKSKVAKPIKKCNLKRIPHGDPRKIEDTFPLAITFQSAPKAVGIPRIRRYIQDFYKETVPDNRWRKAVEGGAEKGSWEYISGSGISGRLHLLMDDFDPESEHLEDRICAGIIACHEPKAASSLQMKKYVSRYHPDFNVEGRPDTFKSALIRAAKKSMIVQVSGLGANGSFQLCDTFVPSPAVLSGENASTSDEEDDSSDEEPVYIPKGTKSRGNPKKSSFVASKDRKQVSTPHKPMSKGKSGASKGRGRPPNKVTGGKKRTAKQAVKHRHSSDESTDEGEGEDEPEYTPRKSQSRGGPARGSAQKSGTKKKGQKKKSKSPSTFKRSGSSDEDGDDDELSELEYTPKKSQSRGGLGGSVKKSPKSPQTPKARASSASPVKSRVTVKKPASAKSDGSLVTTLRTDFHQIEEESGKKNKKKGSKKGKRKS